MSSATATSPVIHFIDGLNKVGGLKGTDIANFANVSKATVSRWTSGKKSPHPEKQLMLSDLHYIVMRLEEYYTASEIRAWLYARHPQLEGRRAIDLIHNNQSLEVLQILDRLDADAYI